MMSKIVSAGIELPKGCDSHGRNGPCGDPSITGNKSVPYKKGKCHDTWFSHSALLPRKSMAYSSFIDLYKYGLKYQLSSPESEVL